MANESSRLDRFLDAQNPIYANVVAELRSGAKRTHWMWFIFPQIAGLGRSETASYFAIADLEEAMAYLSHPILGERLRECTQLVNQVQGREIHQIFGSPDDLKFRSCMTLFEACDQSDGEFSRAIDKYFSGERDLATRKLAGVAGSP